jgi:hypothetical protein
MVPQDSEFWTKARRARDQLAGQFLSHPEVRLIDLSYDVEKGKPAKQLVLRVHIRQQTDQQALGLPEEVDGFPVRVMVGDYHPQSGS